MASQDLDKFGPFGKYNEVVVVNNTTKKFTVGTDVGAAALIIEDGATGTATLARGGVINLAKLEHKTLHEIGISSITVSNSKDVYVLKR